MKTTLTGVELAAIIPKLIHVLETGKEWEDESAHYPAGALIEAVLSIRGVTKNTENEDASDGFSTNGWQYDWWQEFDYNGKQYTLTGSGYYGGHSFSLSEEP